MVALRNLVLKILAGFAFVAMLTPAAQAMCGNCGYSSGYYSQYYAQPAYNWAWGTGCASCGYYRSGYINPLYPAPVGYLDPVQPRRYFVNQGPVYSGPNVAVFGPRYYVPGYVATQYYPYVGNYRTAYTDPYAQVYRPYRPRVYRPYAARYYGAKVIRSRY